MPAFDYKVVTKSASEMEDESEEEMLNALGADGYELVSVTVSQVTYLETSEGDDDEEGEEYTEDVVTYYLKRQNG
jgi:hypothetical protein